MSHITLEEYIASLPQSLSETQKVEKANEWKQTHQPKQDEVEVEEVETKEEVKEPAVAEKDTTVTAETTEVSEPSDSGDGKPTFVSMYDKDVISENSLNQINQIAERAISMDARRALATSRVSFEDPYADFDKLIEEEGVGEAGKIDLEKVQAVLPTVDKAEKVPDQVRSFIEAESLSKEQFDTLQNEFFNKEDLFKP